MHYLASFTWLFDLRYWRLLPLVCRHHSEESPQRMAPFGERVGMDGVFLACAIWTHFWKIKSDQPFKSLSCSQVWQHEAHSHFKDLCSTWRVGGEPEKIERGVNFAWQPGEVCVCQNAAFSPPLPCNIVRKFESLVKETACCAHRAFTRGLFAPVLTRWIWQKADCQGLVWASVLERCHLS